MERIPCSTPGCPNSIPAPPEATKRTEYTCAFCIELGAVGAVHEPPSLDRCQFDNFKIRPDQSEFPRSLLTAACKTAWAIAKTDVSGLSDQQQIIFFMRIWLGMKPVEISKYLRISSQIVRNKLQMAKEKMDYARVTDKH